MLEPASIARLFENTRNQKKFSAGQVIFTAAEKGEVMYAIVNGEVDLVIHDKVVETIQGGDVFGEGAIVRNEHLRVSTAIAKTDCQLAILDKEHFMFLVQENPVFGLMVIKSLSDRLVSLKQKL